MLLLLPGLKVSPLLCVLLLLVLLLCALLLSRSAMAQLSPAAIAGVVKDTSGAVMPGVKLSLTNTATNQEVSVQTDSSGDFVAPNLSPGAYNLKTEASGFKMNLVEGVRLLANRTVRIDVTLEPGEITRQIEVAASAPVVNSESATIGNVMESQMITTLPLNGRTLDRLIRISAGVTSDSASNPRVAGSSYWGGIQFNVDGVTYNDSGNGGGAYSYRNGLSTLPSRARIA